MYGSAREESEDYGEVQPPPTAPVRDGTEVCGVRRDGLLWEVKLTGPVPQDGP